MTDDTRICGRSADASVANVTSVTAVASVCAATEIPLHGAPHDPSPQENRGDISNESAGYEMTASGVYWVDDGGERLWLSSPIEAVADSRDADSARWGRVYVVRDRDGHDHSVAIPAGSFAGDGTEVLRVLLDHGARITPGRKHRDRLLVYLQTAPAARRMDTVDAAGWHVLTTGEAVFVLGDRVLGAASDRVLYRPDTRQAVFATGGTLNGWQANVAAKCVGNSRLVFAIAVALAGSLLYATGDESGGFHVVGSSSCGKTTMLYVAGSIWGSHAYLRRWRATANAIDAMAAQHCDTLLVLDELGQVDPKEAGGIAYSLSNGQGKARAHRTGTAKPVVTWRLLFLSAGEIGLALHMLESGRKVRAGQETRLAEIPAETGAGLGLFETLHDAQNPATFANQLKDAANRDYGHVGPAFVEQLLSRRGCWPELAAAVKECGLKFAGARADGQVQRVARRFALVAVAGELATEWQLTGWSKGTALAAAKTCFDAWVAARGGTGNLEPKHVLAQVRAFLEQHGDARFTPWDGASYHLDSDRVTHRRAGFSRESDGGRWYYVLPETMRQEVLAGLGTRAATRVLVEAGALHLDPDGKATRSERLPGFGKSTRCYVVKPSIWDTDNE